MVYYLDTSALVKLVTAEVESAELYEWACSLPEGTMVSSDLARTQLLRAVKRISPHMAVDAVELLKTLTLLTISTQVLTQAGQLAPVELRTLDAIHLSAGLTLGEDLSGFVTYDNRMASAALECGVSVVHPGATR